MLSHIQICLYLLKVQNPLSWKWTYFSKILETQNERTSAHIKAQADVQLNEVDFKAKGTRENPSTCAPSMSHLHVTPGLSFTTCLWAVEFCYIQSCININIYIYRHMWSRLAVCKTPVLLVVGMVPKQTNLNHAPDLPELHALQSLTCEPTCTYTYWLLSASF